MTGLGHTKTGIVFGIVPATICYVHYDFNYAAFSYLLCVLFSTAPDWLEIQKRNKVQVTRSNGESQLETRVSTVIPHRTITHIVSVWTMGLLVALNSISQFSHNLASYLPQLDSKISASALLGMCCGGLIHLTWDIPNKKPIPVFTPWDKLGLNLWKSGKNEGKIVVITAIASLFISGTIAFPEQTEFVINQIKLGFSYVYQYAIGHL